MPFLTTKKVSTWQVTERAGLGHVIVSYCIIVSIKSYCHPLKFWELQTEKVCMICRSISLKSTLLYAKIVDFTIAPPLKPRHSRQPKAFPQRSHNDAKVQMGLKTDHCRFSPAHFTHLWCHGRKNMWIIILRKTGILAVKKLWLLNGPSF